MTMNRREALTLTATGFGLALTTSALATLLQGCSLDTPDPWVPQTLSEQQVQDLAAIAETLLPATPDSPGATDVGVHRFVDTLLTHWASPETRTIWLEKFGLLQQSITDHAEASAFTELDREDQNQILTKVNQRALKGGDRTEPERFFLDLKRMIIDSYFSSREVGMNVLAYDPVPGVYQGCVPLAQVGKAWSL